MNAMERRVRSVKHNNRKVVLDLLRNSGIVSIAEIADQARISKPTAQKIIDYFISEKLVVSAGKGLSTDDGGKKPSLFQFNPMHGYVISVHIWPDKMTAVITDLNAEILHSEENLLGRSVQSESVVDMVADVVRRYSSHAAVKDLPLIGIAIALPGIADYDRGSSIFSPHFPHWESDFPFRDMLLKKVDLNVPVYVDNVNRYQALAEREKGIARGKDNFLIVDALIEGLGAGFIVGGEIKHGAHNLAGEIGHMILDPHGYPCICGGVGCFEAMVSVKRVLKNVRDGYEQYPDSLIFHNRKPSSVKIEHVFEAFGKADAFAKAIIDDVIMWFALGLSNVLMVYDPQMIILQGIYTELGDYFLNELRSRVKTVSLPAIKKNIQIEYSKFGPERGVTGGAAYVCGNYFKRDLWKKLGSLTAQRERMKFGS